jgi:PHAX RNA-binding domain
MTDEPLTPESLADLLGETDPDAQKQLKFLLRHLGDMPMRALLDAVWTIEAQGGMRRLNGERRTPGGVLFALTRVGFPLSMLRRRQQRAMEIATPGEGDADETTAP